MNRRYIDFVPTGQKKVVKSKSGARGGSALAGSGGSASAGASVSASGAGAAPYRAMPQNRARVARQRVTMKTAVRQARPVQPVEKPQPRPTRSRPVQQ